MNPILHKLYQKKWVWSAANAHTQTAVTKAPTGFIELDKELNTGFPEAGMIHIQSLLGCGELRLILNILQQQIRTEQKFYFFINAPFILSAEFLMQHQISLNDVICLQTEHTQALWSAEQCLKSGACHAVFLWSNELKYTQIQKLEVAALHGNSHAIWFDTNIKLTNQSTSRNNLPLSLSISLNRADEQLQIKINKQKRGWANKTIKVPLPFKTRTKYTQQHAPLQSTQTKKLVNLNAYRR